MDKKLRLKQLAKRHKRRNVGVGITLPEQLVSLREIIDCTAKGKPLNVNVRAHKPLPSPDMTEDDFEKDSEELVDLTDAMVEGQRVLSELEDRKQKRQEDAKKKQEEEIERRISEEVAKRVKSQKPTGETSE